MKGVGLMIIPVIQNYPGNLPQPESEQIEQPDNTPDVNFDQPPFGAGPAFFCTHRMINVFILF